MLPSKVVNISDSILWKLVDVINILKNCSNIYDAYNVSINKKIEINDFLVSIDILYLLDLIYFFGEEGNYKYVEANYL